jgi:mycothiol synthase
MEPSALDPFLPDGYAARPLSLDDAAAVADLLNAYAQAFTGEDECGPDVLVREWQSPEYDPATDGLVVTAPDGTVAAYADLFDTMPPHVRAHSWCRVHPDHRGLGLGSAALKWIHARSVKVVPKAPPEARVIVSASVLAKDEAAHELLESRGWMPTRSFYLMRIDFDRPPEPPTFPEDLELTTFAETGTVPDLARAVDEAFADHWGHVKTEEDVLVDRWEYWIREDPDHDPSLWFLAMAEDEIAGFSLCSLEEEGNPERGWVSTLGVRRPWRRRGLGLALLRQSFAELHARGRRGVGLGVDAESPTGATRLYEKAGMVVVRRSDTFERELRPGKDLSNRA